MHIASFRWFIAVHSVVITGLLTLVQAIVKDWNVISSTIVVIAIIWDAAFIIWFLIDAAVVLGYLKKIEPLRGPQPFVERFMLDGVTWRQLRPFVHEAEAALQELLVRAEPFPELKIRDVFRQEGMKKAKMLLNAAEMQRLSNARIEAEKAIRAERAEREGEELVRTGIELGIPEDTMRSLVAENHDHARGVIVGKREANAILNRAKKNGCDDFVAPLIQAEKIQEAEKAVARVSSLLERARALDMERSVREHIAAGAVGVAEEEVAGAEQQQESARLMIVLETRIRRLSPARQAEALALRERLGYFRYGTREFRKALHELEESIAR